MEQLETTAEGKLNGEEKTMPLDEATTLVDERLTRPELRAYYYGVQKEAEDRQQAKLEQIRHCELQIMEHVARKNIDPDILQTELDQLKQCRQELAEIENTIAAAKDKIGRIDAGLL